MFCEKICIHHIGLNISLQGGGGGGGQSLSLRSLLREKVVSNFYFDSNPTSLDGA